MSVASSSARLGIEFFRHERHDPNAVSVTHDLRDRVILRNACRSVSLRRRS